MRRPPDTAPMTLKALSRRSPPPLPRSQWEELVPACSALPAQAHARPRPHVHRITAVQYTRAPTTCVCRGRARRGSPPHVGLTHVWETLVTQAHVYLEHAPLQVNCPSLSAAVKLELIVVRTCTNCHCSPTPPQIRRPQNNKLASLYAQLASYEHERPQLPSLPRKLCSAHAPLTGDAVCS